MNDDWLYSRERLDLRANCLKVLLYKYGGHLKEDGHHATAHNLSTPVSMTGCHKDILRLMAS